MPRSQTGNKRAGHPCSTLFSEPEPVHAKICNGFGAPPGGVPVESQKSRETSFYTDQGASGPSSAPPRIPFASNRDLCRSFRVSCGTSKCPLGSGRRFQPHQTPCEDRKRKDSSPVSMVSLSTGKAGGTAGESYHEKASKNHFTKALEGSSLRMISNAAAYPASSLITWKYAGRRFLP